MIYYLTIYTTYLAVFFLTFFSFTLGVITGLFTTAIGAYTTFGLTNKFIRKIHFNPERVFLLGGLSFLINDLLLIPTISTAIEPLYSATGWIHTAFAGPFLFWQVIVGTKLFTKLQKAEQ